MHAGSHKIKMLLGSAYICCISLLNIASYADLKDEVLIHIIVIFKCSDSIYLCCMCDYHVVLLYIIYYI